MKQNLLNLTSRLMMSVLLLTFVITSCTKKTSEIAKTASLEEFTTATSGKQPGTLTAVSLKMTVNDAIGNKITSDGGGDYVNGTQNLKVVFDQSGNLIFNTRANSGKPRVRLLNYNFDNPLQVFINPGFTNATAGYISSIKSNSFISFTPLQSLAVGESECVGLALPGGSGTFASGWAVLFHRDPNDDFSASPTSFATVTRISTTEWTMTPGTCSISANTDVAALRNGATLYGFYHMPYSFTLTKL